MFPIISVLYEWSFINVKMSRRNQYVDIINEKRRQKNLVNLRMFLHILNPYAWQFINVRVSSSQTADVFLQNLNFIGYFKNIRWMRKNELICTVFSFFFGAALFIDGRVNNCNYTADLYAKSKFSRLFHKYYNEGEIFLFLDDTWNFSCILMHKILQSEYSYWDIETSKLFQAVYVGLINFILRYKGSTNDHYWKLEF